MKVLCKDCIFFDPNPKHTGSGFCCRYAPRGKIHITKAAVSNKVHCAFIKPLTYTNNWCGEGKSVTPPTFSIN